VLLSSVSPSRDGAFVSCARQKLTLLLLCVHIIVTIIIIITNTNNGDDDKSEWHILFNQRPLHLKSHPGEVCFPGGRQEEADEGDDVTTALRETMEEVGIPVHEVVPLARTTTAESVGGLCVTPIVGVWTNPVPLDQLKTNADEVEAVFSVPLSYFWDETNCADKQDIDWRGETFTMRTYMWKDGANEQDTTKWRTFKIWGLTAHVVHEVAQLCKPLGNQVMAMRQSYSSKTSGSLYRWMDDSNGNSYWTQRYYVLSVVAGNINRNSPSVLHQYESEEKAKTKSATATKKNRIVIHNGCEVLLRDTKEAGHEGNDKWIFTVSALNGRVVWKLAASSSADRDRWVSAVRLITGGMNDEDDGDHNSIQSSNKKLKTSPKARA